MEKGGEIKGRLLVIVVVILALLNLSHAMVVSIGNDMPGPIAVQCFGNVEGDLGLKFLSVGKSYDFTVPGRFFSGRKYSCTFVATGKPTTTFDVFTGWGGVKNTPCECTGEVCQWVVNEKFGFACNNYAYTRPWATDRTDRTSIDHA